MEHCESEAVSDVEQLRIGGGERRGALRIRGGERRGALRIRGGERRGATGGAWQHLRITRDARVMMA
jgi:hypothetical protein